MTQPDVLILGAGVIGASIAWRLAAAGLDVVVVDAGAAGGTPPATLASAGMLAPSFERAHLGAETPLAAFSRESLRQWADFAAALEAASGLSVDFDRRGVLAVAFDEAGLAALRQSTAGEALSGDAARALEPALAPEVIGAVFSAGDAQVDPLLVARALDVAMAGAGVRALRGRRAVAIEGGDGYRVLLDDGARLSAGLVVIATGARLPAGAPLADGAVFPVKGEAYAAARPAAGPWRVIRSAGAYLCPKADGRVFVGATELPGETGLDVRADAIDALAAAAAKAAPAMRGARELSRWAGLRPATADGAPIIGSSATTGDRLFYALGHYRNGVLLAPATAAALAALILGGAPAPAAFSPDRFASLGVS